MKLYNSIKMNTPPSGLDTMLLSLLGGGIIMVIVSNIGIAFLVTTLLSFGSYIGKNAGVIVWRIVTKKYKDLKNKKHIK